MKKSWDKLVVFSILLSCASSYLAAADLTLKDGRVFRNYRIKDVAGNAVTIEHTGSDGKVAAEVADLSQLPLEVAFLYGVSVPAAPAKRAVVPAASGDAGSPVKMREFVEQLKNISDRTERLKAAEDIKMQLEQEISSRGLQDEFSVVWVDSDGLLVRVLRDNGSLKTNELIFVKGARSLGNRSLLTVYPAGFRKKYGSFGSVKVFALQSSEAAAEAARFICRAAGDGGLLESGKNVAVNSEPRGVRHDLPAAPLPAAEPAQPKFNPLNQTYDYDSGITRGSWRDQRSKRRTADNDRRGNYNPVNTNIDSQRQSDAKRAEEMLKQAKNFKMPVEAVTNVNYNKAKLTSNGGIRESEQVAERQSYSDLRNSSVRANEASTARQSYSDIRNSSYRASESAAERQSYSNVRNVRESESAAERQSYSNVRNVRESESASERQSYSNVRNVRENEQVAERQSYSNVRNVRENESASERQSYSNVRNVRENEQVTGNKKYSDIRNVRENESVNVREKYSEFTKNKVVEEPKIKIVQEEQAKSFAQKKQIGNCQGEGVRRKVCETPKLPPKKSSSFSGGPIIKRDKRKVFTYDHISDKFRKK